MMPRADTEAMQAFLDRFSKTLADVEHVAMFADQAGWHIANDLEVPGNITLLPLPSYSPELNPVQRLWLYLKQRFLSHRLLDDYDAIVDAACVAWTVSWPKSDASNRCAPTPGSKRSFHRLDGIRSICLPPERCHDDNRNRASRVGADPASL